MPAAPYLDTSVLVAALTAEPLTELAQRHLALSRSVVVAISEALSGFRRLMQDSLDCLPVTGDDFRAAAALADRATAGLRAGDALHLAVASRAGCTVHTFDRAMAGAAESLGLSCRLASPP